MSDLRKAAKMALTALEPEWWESEYVVQGKEAAAREALRQALAQPERMSERYCVNCKHFLDQVVPKCAHTNLGLDLVTGRQVHVECHRTRRLEFACGEAGKWYEPRAKEAVSA